MAVDAEQAVPAAQAELSLGNEPDPYGISHILPYEPGFAAPVSAPAAVDTAAACAGWDHGAPCPGRAG